MKEYFPILITVIVIGVLIYKNRTGTNDDSGFDDFDFD